MANTTTNPPATNPPFPSTILIKSSSTNTRSANDDLLLVIPPLSRNCSNTYFERFLIFAAPTEWNRLDKRTWRISNLNNFKSEIKIILILNYFDV